MEVNANQRNPIVLNNITAHIEKLLFIVVHCYLDVVQVTNTYDKKQIQYMCWGLYKLLATRASVGVNTFSIVSIYLSC